MYKRQPDILSKRIASLKYLLFKPAAMFIPISTTLEITVPDVYKRQEPHGCFCRNLKESLKVQCELSENPASETGTILCDFLEDVYKRQHFKSLLSL